MNHPNGPYGQGFPGQQPGYGQPPAYGPPAGPPQQPWYPQLPVAPQQPYGPPPTSPPSGVTGIIAGVLAGLGGAVNVVGGIFMAIGLAVMTSDSSFGIESGVWTALIAITMLNVIAGALLSIGTVMLLLRKMIGRWLVVAGCAVSIVSSVISLGMSSTVADYQISGRGADAVGLIFPIATLVLVLLPSTTAWIQAKQNSAAPPPYPPYRG